MIPGINLLALAQSAIAPTTITYYRWLGRATNDIGLDVNSFAEGETRKANIQAVDRREYSKMGLDYTERYIEIYAIEGIDDLYTNRTGDQIVWNSARYEIKGRDDWKPIDGWNYVLAIEVGNT